MHADKDKKGFASFSLTPSLCNVTRAVDAETTIRLLHTTLTFIIFYWL